MNEAIAQSLIHISPLHYISSALSSFKFIIFESFSEIQISKANFINHDTTTTDYRRDPNKSGGGTQLLHAPPTAHMVHSISSLAVAVDTLGGYNWRHRGVF